MYYLFISFVVSPVARATRVTRERFPLTNYQASLSTHWLLPAATAFCFIRADPCSHYYSDRQRSYSSAPWNLLLQNSRSFWRSSCAGVSIASEPHFSSSVLLFLSIFCLLQWHTLKNKSHVQTLKLLYNSQTRQLSVKLNRIPQSSFLALWQ